MVTTGNIVRGGANPADLSRGQRIFFELPWHLATLFLRVAYGFRVEGMENLPRDGPFILANNEHSPIAFLITGWVAIVALKQAFQRGPETISFMREELFDFPFFRNALNDKAPGRYAPLAPITAGRLALGLLEAYHVLQSGGIVVLNPEGDMPWDGRPLPIGHALAWLGLHTGAPIVPAVTTIGAYDIWPRWQSRMNRHGQVRLRIGRPVRLTDAPRDRVAVQDMDEAERTMRARFDELCYGPGGMAEWAGVPTRSGQPLEGPVHLPSLAGSPSLNGINRAGVPLWRRGMALLLWRCPMCHSDNALVHDQPLFGEPSLRCRVCHTRWKIHHSPGKDFRLEVTQGPADLIGLEMALSAWYDEMRRDLQPGPAQSPGSGLNTREETIAEATGVALLPRRPNALIESWNGREPPRLQPSVEPQRSGWESIGKGRLVLTNERLIWKGARGELDFWWRRVNSISLWMLNTLTIRYGTAPYRFELGQENGLKWLTFASIQAQRTAAISGQKLRVSPY